MLEFFKISDVNFIWKLRKIATLPNILIPYSLVVVIRYSEALTDSTFRTEE
jgi:hypothetical protein